MKSTPKIVWHYTKMSVLGKIFPPKENEKYKKGEITLRFTNDKFLKDPSEGLILKEFFKTNRNSILENLSDDLQEKINGEQFRNKSSNSIFSYVFSTTYLEDSFAFWNKEYAGWNGVALGIKWASITRDNSMLIDNVKYVNPDPEIKPSKNLIEKISEYLKTSNKFYEDNKVSFSKDISILDILFSFFSNMYKHKSWEYEKEARIATLKERFKTLETEFCDDKIMEVGYKNFSKDIIYSIMLGPACKEEEVKAVENYLKSNGYDNILVERSHAFDSLDKRLLEVMTRGKL